MKPVGLLPKNHNSLLQLNYEKINLNGNAVSTNVVSDNSGINDIADESSGASFGFNSGVNSGVNSDVSSGVSSGVSSDVNSNVEGQKDSGTGTSSLNGIPPDLIQLGLMLGITDPSQLPSIDEAMNLLGTSSREETIREIRELASTPEGLNLIKMFVGNSDSGAASENVPFVVNPTGDVQPRQHVIPNEPINYNRNVQQISPQQFQFVQNQNKNIPQGYYLVPRPGRYSQNEVIQQQQPRRPLTTSLLSLTGIPSAINRGLIDYEISQSIVPNSPPTTQNNTPIPPPLNNFPQKPKFMFIPVAKHDLSKVTKQFVAPFNFHTIPKGYPQPSKHHLQNYDLKTQQTQQDLPTLNIPTHLNLPVKDYVNFHNIYNVGYEQLVPSESKQVIVVAHPEFSEKSQDTNDDNMEVLENKEMEQMNDDDTLNEEMISNTTDKSLNPIEITTEMQTKVIEVKPKRNSPTNSYATGAIHTVNPEAIRLLPFTIAKSFSSGQGM